MYLLYLDESGNERDAADAHFVLAGAAVFERQTFFLSQAMDEIQTRHFPGRPPVHFHATDIRAGRKFWRRVRQPVRTAVLNEIGQAIADVRDPGLALFAAVIEKTDMLYGEEAVHRAAEEVCKRFDTFLARRRYEENDNQRGLLVFAESTYRDRARLWVQDFREWGTRWGTLNYLSDIPYFAKAVETRLLQVADYVAHALFLLYERRNPTLAQLILEKLDNKDGIIHGLVHIKRNPSMRCDCPACVSRDSPGSLGPWVSQAPVVSPAAR